MAYWVALEYILSIKANEAKPKDSQNIIQLREVTY